MAKEEPTQQAELPGHGADVLPSVVVESYNVEIEDADHRVQQPEAAGVDGAGGFGFGCGVHGSVSGYVFGGSIPVIWVLRAITERT